MDEVIKVTMRVIWYTPDKYLNAVRECLGGIDLDPATDDRGQIRVQARTFYTAANPGLDKPWYGTVMLCPPYTPVDLMAQFINKLIAEYQKGNVTAAVCFLPTNATWEEWFQAAIRASSAVCFVGELIQWFPGHLPELLLARELGIDWQNAPSYDTRGTAIIYYGLEKGKFRDIFYHFGGVL